MSDIILPYGEQKDGSVIDLFGNVLSLDDRLTIIEQVEGLPATGMRDDIVHTVGDNVITIINGETGSGKTTQIGKMLFDSKKRITITQPRVVAAMSNADRISQELLAETGNPYYSLGHGVGYRTGRGVSSAKTSPLSLHTDGVELRRMAYSNIVPDILVLDEIHGFSIPTEVLAMLMKYREDIKIVIMSATLDPQVFQDYYSHISSDIPVINIPGRTYPVTKYFNPGENYIEAIATEYNGKEGIPGKNILFFVPGKKEIDIHIELLQKKLGKNAEIFPLHADLSKEEKETLLIKTTDKPRIIVSTNVAEESVTIPYIDLVADLGTHKVSRYNDLGIQELRLENTPQASCLQRGGRSGRTHDGIYIRFNNTPFEKLPKYLEAPIEREMLDTYILVLLANGKDIIKLQEEESSNGRGLFFHEFNKKLLEISYYRLTQIGAIDRTKNITPLGRDLLQLPLDVYHARMLREAIKRKCVDDMIYATAILEKKGFVSKDGRWKKIKLSTSSQDSDIFGYTELLKLITATSLPEEKRRILLSLGIDTNELKDFVDRGGEFKLYELVDLSILGIKNKKVKEIDELMMNLRERLTSSGIEITSSDNINDKKICLTSGSLHNVYQYDGKLKKLKNRDHKTGKNTLYFQAGNVTLIEPTTHHLYLGQPFIIGGTEDTEDLNILTGLTQIDEVHIRDARISTRTFSMPSHTNESKGGAEKTNENGKKRTEGSDEIRKTTRNDIRISLAGEDTQSFAEMEGDMTPYEAVPYERIFNEGTGISDPERAMFSYEQSFEEYGDLDDANFFKTQDDARTYYLKYCLPGFLIKHNIRIRKYLEHKTVDEIFTFQELLRRFLLDSEIHRIHPKSIEKTELSFRHDTTILDRFLESTDKYIQAFRKGQMVVLPSDEKELLAKISDENDSINNREIFALQKQYVEMLGSIRSELKAIDTEKIKMKFLKDYFLFLESSSPEYGVLWSTYKEIGDMERKEVKYQMMELKAIERKTKILGKKQHKRGEILNVVNTIESLILGEKHIDIRYLYAYDFEEDMSEKYMKKYYNALRLSQSEDNKQQQRGARHLKNVVGDIRVQMLKLDTEIEQLVTETDLGATPYALKIQNSLETLCMEFFDMQYFTHVVSGKLLELTRQISRDQVSENLGLEKILFHFFDTKDFKHIKERRGVFQAIADYTDIIDTLNIYSSTILSEIKEIRDVEKIQLRIGELRTKIAELRSQKKQMIANGIIIS